MTREQAIEILKSIFAYDSNFVEAKQMAIEALKRETSENCISREYMLEKAQEWKNMYPDSDTAREALTMLMNEIDNAPSVVPSRAEGKWIRNDYEHARELWNSETKCSICGYKLGGAEPNYCPNCGARME